MADDEEDDRDPGVNLSDAVQILLVGLYAVMAVVDTWTRRWPFALYWAGAALLTAGVVWARLIDGRR